LGLAQGGQMVVPGEGLGGVEQGTGLALLRGHFPDQSQHGRTAAALTDDQVAQAARHRLQAVINRSALDACDKHGDTSLVNGRVQAELMPYYILFYMFYL